MLSQFSIVSSTLSVKLDSAVVFSPFFVFSKKEFNRETRLQVKTVKSLLNRNENTLGSVHGATREDLSAPSVHKG